MRSVSIARSTSSILALSSSSKVSSSIRHRSRRIVPAASYSTSLMVIFRFSFHGLVELLRQGAPILLRQIGAKARGQGDQGQDGQGRIGVVGPEVFEMPVITPRIARLGSD